RLARALADAHHARPPGAVVGDAIHAIGSAAAIRVPDADAATEDVAAVARAAAARAVAGRVRVRIRRRRTGGAARSARARAHVRDASVAARMRPVPAARANAACAELARAIRRHHAILPVRARAPLSGADPAAIDAGLVLVMDRVGAGIRDARSATDMEAGPARHEYAGAAAAGTDAVRVYGGAVHAARSAAAALVGDADVSNLNVPGIAGGERAGTRGARAGSVGEGGGAIGTGGTAALVGVRGARIPAGVETTLTDEGADDPAA